MRRFGRVQAVCALLGIGASTCSQRSSSSLTSAAARSALDAAQRELASLREALAIQSRTIASLSGELVALRNAAGVASGASSHASRRDAEVVVVSTAEELDAALSDDTKTVQRIIVALDAVPQARVCGGGGGGGGRDNTITMLCAHRISDFRTVEIVGAAEPSDATCHQSAQGGGAGGGSLAKLVGEIVVENGGRLHMTNIELVASTPHTAPCLTVSGRESRATLVSCALRGGRDGVFVSGGAHCTLTNCTLADNLRGVFESFRCSVAGSSCKFTNNHYHCVLLGSRVQDPEVLPRQFCASDFDERGCKGDVVFEYNPVSDMYLKVYKCGVLVMRTEELATEGLAEQMF